MTLLMLMNLDFALGAAAAPSDPGKAVHSVATGDAQQSTAVGRSTT